MLQRLFVDTHEMYYVDILCLWKFSTLVNICTSIYAGLSLFFVNTVFL